MIPAWRRHSKGTVNLGRDLGRMSRLQRKSTVMSLFSNIQRIGGGVEKERKSTHILLTAHTFGPMKNLYGRQEEMFMLSRPPHTKIAC